MSIPDVDIEVKWHITFLCNFRCSYCFSKRHWKDVCNEFRDIDAIVDGFNRLGLTCQISISGGEPFIFPKFVDLCKKLTSRHIVCITTNLSQKAVYRFAEEIDPGRVRFMNCSLNMRERLRHNLVEDYIKKYHLLKDKGFFVVATYVVDPSLVKRLPSDYAFFKSRGVILRPKVFRGMHMGYPFLEHPRLWRLRHYCTREYPQAYTAREKAVILKYIDEGQKDTDMRWGTDIEELGGRFSEAAFEKRFINGVPTFKGNECAAGRKLIKMDPQGEVHSCYSGVDRHMGNLFKEGVTLLDTPIICPYDSCGCPYFGYTYSKPRTTKATHGN